MIWYIIALLVKVHKNRGSLLVWVLFCGYVETDSNIEKEIPFFHCSPGKQLLVILQLTFTTDVL